MSKKSFLNRILQNTRHPEGFWGRMMLRSMNILHAPLAEWAMRMVEWQPGWTVLDVGCGGGANIARMLELCPDGKVHGVDISEESVLFACKRNRRWTGSRCFIRQGDVCRLPYDGGQFDVVTAFETVYFWQDLPTSFGEVRRVLRPGGMFLICCEVCNPDNNMWTNRIEHMRVYSPDELKALLHDAGFTDVNVYQRPKEDLCVIAHNQQNNKYKL